MKTRTFLWYFSCLFCLFSQTARAELLRSIPNLVHLHVAPERGWSGHVGTELPQASFAGFDNGDVGRWLTLATGPEFVNLSGSHSVAFTGQLAPDRCRTVNSPVPMIFKSWDEKSIQYAEQTKELNRCVVLRVRDNSGIQPATQHPACEILKISDKEILAQGGLCYFKINPNSFFTISYELSPKCTDLTNINTLFPKSNDIFASTSFYISGDSTGRSNLLKPLGSGVLRYSVEPSQSETQLSVDMGEGAPRWPVEAYPDIHMGQVTIEGKAQDARLTTHVFVKNDCPAGRLSACSSSLPVGVQYSLKEIKTDGRVRLLDQWYAGGVAPVAWEGFLSAQRNITNFELKAGSRYRIEADLTYMSIYYRLFKEGFKNYLIQRGQWNINPNSPLIPIAPIALIPGLSAFQPSSPLPVASHLTPGGKQDFQLELNQLRAMLTGVDWPPYYEEMCGEDGCARAQTGSAKLKVAVDFRFVGYDAPDEKIADISVSRESSFQKEYSGSVGALFQVVCK
jgi:hypothetical protein